MEAERANTSATPTATNTTTTITTTTTTNIFKPFATSDWSALRKVRGGEWEVNGDNEGEWLH